MNKKILIIVAALAIAFGIGYFISSIESADNSNTTEEPVNNNSEASDDLSSNEGVKSLVTYSLPDGWMEAGCDNSPGSVFIIPAGSGNVECSTNPSSPVKLSVDSGNTKDCNELQNVSDVKKHVCISLYINDMRSLKATTEYLASSPYGQETSINAYYIDTGNGVIKAEYIYTTDNEYQIGFDEMVNGINAR